MDSNKTILGIVILVVILGGGYLLMSGNQSDEVEDIPVSNGTVTNEVGMEDKDMMEDKEMMEETKTIVDIAAGNEDFETLVAAVTEAGLVETLSGEGPFTVFAPTDAAFAKIPEETLTAILADKEQLTSILTYHVVSGEVMAADVVELTSATTVQGQDLTISVDADGTVMVNDAKVLITDIKASNGVIHVIDTVVLPQ